MVESPQIPLRCPYLLRSERLAMRPWRPDEAQAMADAVTRNLDHLKPWMPWTYFEPEGLDARLNRILTWRASMDRGEDFTLGVFDAAGGGVLGGVGLHNRVGPKALEIGYWIDREQTGKGLASEAASSMVRVAFDVLAVERVEIHCDPENLPSARIPEKLGFTREGRLRQRIPWPDRTATDKLVFSLLRNEYEAGDLPRFPLAAWDALDRPQAGMTWAHYKKP